MKICIPSYNRLSGVQEKTLKLLNKYDVANINIFVSTEKTTKSIKKKKWVILF